jgi:hypothetical protein
MTASAAEKPTTQISIDGKDQLEAVGEEVRAMADTQTQAVAQAMQMLAESVNRMNKPKQRLLQRGPDGRAVGVIEVEIEDANEKD